jgi:polar amino acid transport system substrate-binding protein
MYVTPKRCQEILFSDPTYRIGEGFIVRKGNPLDLHSYEDVARHDSARLGVMGGAVEHGYARALAIPEERIVAFEDYPTALVGLETGRIDAVGATSLTVNVLLRKAGGGKFERAQPFREPVIDGQAVAGYGAFGFRKDDWELRAAFNRELRAFLGTPEHLELVARFGFSKETLPGDTTATSLCASDG